MLIDRAKIAAANGTVPKLLDRIVAAMSDLELKSALLDNEKWKTVFLWEGKMYSHIMDEPWQVNHLFHSPTWKSHEQFFTSTPLAL